MNKDYEVCALLILSEKREELTTAETAEAALQIAFKVAYRHWMFNDEQVQFKGAVGAVLMALKSGPEFEKVDRSITVLSKLTAVMNALQNGVPVDIETMLKDQEKELDRDKIIPLTKLWQEAKREAA